MARTCETATVSLVNLLLKGASSEEKQLQQKVRRIEYAFSQKAKGGLDPFHFPKVHDSRARSRDIELRKPKAVDDAPCNPQ